MSARDKIELEILAKTGRADIAEQIGQAIEDTIAEAAERMGIDPDKIRTEVQATIISVDISEGDEQDTD